MMPHYTGYRLSRLIFSCAVMLGVIAMTYEFLLPQAELIWKSAQDHTVKNVNFWVYSAIAVLIILLPILAAAGWVLGELGKFFEEYDRTRRR